MIILFAPAMAGVVIIGVIAVVQQFSRKTNV